MLKRILVLILVSFAAVFIVAYAFLLIWGRSIIAGQIEAATGRKASIGYVGLSLPPRIEIKRLEIDGLLSADSISASPSVLKLLGGKLVFNAVKVVKPVVTYERRPALAAEEGREGLAAILPIPLPAHQAEAPVPAGQKKVPPIGFKRLQVQDARIDLIDYTVSQEGLRITVKDLDLTLNDLYLYPLPVNTDFKLTARIPWREGEQQGSIRLEGWANFFKRDMQATLKVSDIDGIYLYPYYSQYVDLEKARIEKAKLNVTGDIKSKDSNLSAQCHLELSDIVFRKPEIVEGEESEKKMITSAVMDIFSALSKTNKIIFNFTAKGKMPSIY